jgi:DNA-directed RNA polymerase subunit RPC12/RpoP
VADTILFCEKCGKQLITIDEIKDGICIDCRGSMKKNVQYETFTCWACGNQLNSMDEVAQGVCQNCKRSIIKKLK